MTQYGTEPGGGSATDQVKDQVRQSAEQAKERTRSAAGQARGRFSDQVDQRSTDAGERLASQAADVRSVADELRRQGKDAPARMVEQVAGQAERFGDYLKGASGDRILRDVEDFARRQPWAVAAGGLALGFAASRFLKASSSRRYQPGDGYGGRYDSTPSYESTSYAVGEPAPVVGTYDPATATTHAPVDAYGTGATERHYDDITEPLSDRPDRSS
jgi:hypothetical protein